MEEATADEAATVVETASRVAEVAATVEAPVAEVVTVVA